MAEILIGAIGGDSHLEIDSMTENNAIIRGWNQGGFDCVEIDYLSLLIAINNQYPSFFMQSIKEAIKISAKS